MKTYSCNKSKGTSISIQAGGRGLSKTRRPSNLGNLRNFRGLYSPLLRWEMKRKSSNSIFICVPMEYYALIVDIR